jgi:hypothetical protein
MPAVPSPGSRGRASCNSMRHCQEFNAVNRFEGNATLATVTFAF